MKQLVNKTDLKNERPRHQRKNERVCAARSTLWDTPKDRDLALNGVAVKQRTESFGYMRLKKI